MLIMKLKQHTILNYQLFISMFKQDTSICRATISQLSFNKVHIVLSCNLMTNPDVSP